MTQYIIVPKTKSTFQVWDATKRLENKRRWLAPVEQSKPLLKNIFQCFET